MKKLLFFLLVNIWVLFFASCSSEKEQPGIDSPLTGTGETVNLSFTVELETDEIQTRGLGDLGFGNGNKINNLVYALYTQDSDGKIAPVIINGSTKNYINVSNPQEIPIPNIEIIKGIEYTLMLWAQYRPENETVAEDDRVYFELRDDGIIRIRSYQDFLFPNNDDQRDVFCAVYKIVQYEDSRELHFILRRPFAQLNIGIPAGILRRSDFMDKSNNLFIETSSITISGDIANRYNLFKNEAEKEDGISYIRTFAENIIPSLAKDNGWSEGNGYVPLKIEDRVTHEIKEYVWLSMCYILPNGELGDVAEIDIKDFKLKYKDKDGKLRELDAPRKVKDKDKEDVFLTGIPALRNRRTNIILSAEDLGLTIVDWDKMDHKTLPVEGDNVDPFKELIEDYFLKFNSSYPGSDDKELISKILEDFNDNILVDDDDYYNIMLGEGEYTDPQPILPIHKAFILYGNGENTIIKKDANSGVYHNIGQVRNLLITDKNGNKHLFIDKDGWVYSYTGGVRENESFYQLTPLAEGYRSYDVYFDGSGRSKQSTYYR